MTIRYPNKEFPCDERSPYILPYHEYTGEVLGHKFSVEFEQDSVGYDTVRFFVDGEQIAVEYAVTIPHYEYMKLLPPEKIEEIVNKKT